MLDLNRRARFVIDYRCDHQKSFGRATAPLHRFTQQTDRADNCCAGRVTHELGKSAQQITWRLITQTNHARQFVGCYVNYRNRVGRLVAQVDPINLLLRKNGADELNL